MIESPVPSKSKPMLISTIRIAIVLAMTAQLGYAGQGTWTSGGPFGGDVTALAINPSTTATIYVGSDGGGKGTGMMYVSGKPDHKVDNADMIDHIVDLVEARARTLRELIFEGAERDPERVLFRFRADTWTTARTVEEARKAAHVLAEAGVRPRDRVMISLAEVDDARDVPRVGFEGGSRALDSVRIGKRAIFHALG